MVSLTVLNLILYNFLEHHIKWAIIFNCWNMNTQVELTEILMANNMYVQLWNINRLKLEVNINGHYVTHNSPHIGIFFDFNCAKGDKVLNKTSQEKLFTDRFHWLIYDDNSNVTKFRQQFKHYNMAVDADVNYVFPNQALLNSVHNFSYLLYDVYNNGYNLGGKLNMTPDKEIICSRKQCELKEYLSTLHEKSKYENRWYLGDMKMRVSTV
uniref:Ionotropic receptor 75a N-terminal domain-containing protein n=1 Tax=Stomoxys calcitrans TaxID=35570 RepID=A0A1I8NNR2_STOCA